METIFRQPPETNYRALRDMGLAAWWGSSLATLASLEAAANAEEDPAERYHVLDRGLKGQRIFMAASVAAYVVGTTLVRFGRLVDDKGRPDWISQGVENTARSASLGAALAAAVAAKKMREKGIRQYDEARRNGRKGEVGEAEKLRRSAHLLHAAVPALVGSILYSHIKQDAAALQGK